VKKRTCDQSIVLLNALDNLARGDLALRKGVNSQMGNYQGDKRMCAVIHRRRRSWIRTYHVAFAKKSAGKRSGRKCVRLTATPRSERDNFNAGGAI
jgi:hypothetical protein